MQHTCGLASGPYPDNPAARVRGLPSQGALPSPEMRGQSGKQSRGRSPGGCPAWQAGEEPPRPSPTPDSRSLRPDRLRNREPAERPARLPGAGARPLGPRPRRAASGPRNGVLTPPHLLLHAVDNDGRILAAEPAEERRDSHDQRAARGSGRAGGLV